MQWVFDTVADSAYSEPRTEPARSRVRAAARSAGPSFARFERRRGRAAAVQRRADRAGAGASCATAVPDAARGQAPARDGGPRAAGVVLAGARPAGPAGHADARCRASSWPATGSTPDCPPRSRAPWSAGTGRRTIYCPDGPRHDASAQGDQTAEFRGIDEYDDRSYHQGLRAAGGRGRSPSELRGEGLQQEGSRTCPGPTSSTASSSQTDRSPSVLRNFQTILNPAAWPAPATSRSCRSTRASSTRRAPASRPTPIYFDPANIVKLAIEGGCNCVASTLGTLGSVVAQVRPQDPVHGEAQPQRVPHLPEQVRPDHVRRASSRRSRWARSRSARRSTSARTSRRGRSRKCRRRSRGPTSSAWSPCSGATRATRRSRPRRRTTTSSADLTGQANHLGVTIEADIIKQKMPENNGGYAALNTKESRTARSTSGSTRTSSRAITRSR